MSEEHFVYFPLFVWAWFFLSVHECVCVCVHSQDGNIFQLQWYTAANNSIFGPNDYMAFLKFLFLFDQFSIRDTVAKIS